MFQVCYVFFAWGMSPRPLGVCFVLGPTYMYLFLTLQMMCLDRRPYIRRYKSAYREAMRGF